MTQELVYTSAEKGLKLGSRGFCTVASTPGMAKPLAERLESLSGYRHLFTPGSPEAVRNPVNIAYVKFRLGGVEYRVLSRVADAGLDHTQRSNKLAHHVVIEGGALPAGGPAWLAQQPGVLLQAWEGAARMLPAHRPLPPGEAAAAPCRAWAAAAGDAGYAGWLVEAAQQAGEAYVIYAPGTDVLALVAEAQALLPASERWQTTFSTYYMKLPPGVECRWRFVAEGTPEADTARRTPGAQVLTLSQPRPLDASSRWVEAARTGVSAAPRTPVRPPTPQAPINPGDQQTLEVGVGPSTQTATPGAFEAPVARDMFYPVRPGDPSIALAPPPLPSDSKSGNKSRGKRSRRLSPAYVLMGLTLFVSLASAAYVAITINQQQRPAERAATNQEASRPGASQTEQSGTSPPAEISPEPLAINSESQIVGSEDNGIPASSAAEDVTNEVVASNTVPDPPAIPEMHTAPMLPQPPTSLPESVAPVEPPTVLNQGQFYVCLDEISDFDAPLLLGGVFPQGFQCEVYGLPNAAKTSVGASKNLRVEDLSKLHLEGFRLLSTSGNKSVLSVVNSETQSAYIKWEGRPDLDVEQFIPFALRMTGASTIDGFDIVFLNSSNRNREAIVVKEGNKECIEPYKIVLPITHAMHVALALQIGSKFYPTTLYLPQTSQSRPVELILLKDDLAVTARLNWLKGGSTAEMRLQSEPSSTDLIVALEKRIRMRLELIEEALNWYESIVGVNSAYLEDRVDRTNRTQAQLDAIKTRIDTFKAGIRSKIESLRQMYAMSSVWDKVTPYESTLMEVNGIWTAKDLEVPAPAIEVERHQERCGQAKAMVELRDALFTKKLLHARIELELEGPGGADPPSIRILLQEIGNPGAE